MSNDIIKSRLSFYNPTTLEDEQSALKEILQDIILYGLSTSDFFRIAAFHGGTSLRILHNLPRFSEDLDFTLLNPDAEFKWKPYMNSIEKTCIEFGVEPEVLDKSKTDSTIQKMFLKDNSIGKIINLRFHHHPHTKFRIKLEIDTNPPAGANSETRFINFPLDAGITAHDLESNFSGKLHALLCRNYIKGRDWYDFSWYTQGKISPNLNLLSEAINQQGPWQEQNIQVDKAWLYSAISKKIKDINWKQASTDVAPFLRSLEKETLKLWSIGFFEDKLSRLIDTMKID